MPWFSIYYTVSDKRGTDEYTTVEFGKDSSDAEWKFLDNYNNALEEGATVSVTTIEYKDE